MTIKEIVQKRYELEIKSLSPQAKRVISSNFSDFSKLMVFHDHGLHVFNSFTSSEYIQQELFDFSNKIWHIYIKEQIVEWKRRLLLDASSTKEIVLESLIDNYLGKVYRLILKTQGQFVQKTIKYNCPNYQQALCFVKKEKSVNDFLRCSESEKQELLVFFIEFGKIYNDILQFYYQKKKESGNENGTSVLSDVFTEKRKTELNKVDAKKNKDEKKEIRKTQHNKNTNTSKNKKANKPKHILDDNRREIKEENAVPKKQIVAYEKFLPFVEIKSPQLYDTPHFIIDDLTMMASINYGCNGIVSFGLSSYYIATSFPFLYNFERDHIKYDPDEIYRKSIVSDRITRSAHRYKWFGANGADYMTSLEEYGIAAKCIDLYFGEYRCYIPVEVDGYDEVCLAEIETTDEMIISTLTKRMDLIQFLEYKDISLRDFKLLEITDKLLFLCDYYDIYDFLGLDDDIFEKSDIILQLQAEMTKKTIDEFLWDSYTLEEKNDFLSQRIKTSRNKEAFLRFNIVKVHYLPFSKEIEVSYLIHSEYSIEVFVNIDVLYKDGSSLAYSHIRVDSYDDQFVYFQGKTRIKSEKDYLNIQLISLTCSDE